MSPVGFRKWLCRPVKFKGQGPPKCTLSTRSLGHLVSGECYRESIRQRMDPFGCLGFKQCPHEILMSKQKASRCFRVKNNPLL